MMREKTPLLTIAIPTFNRANYLDLCLGQISRQIHGNGDLLEVLVSNNNSTDNTKEVVEKYVGMDVPIKYIENSENIGAERNVVQCFNLAKGRYVLILGDDDVLLDESLEKILNLLREGDYGVVYLTGYGFKTDYLKEKPELKPNRILIYRDTYDFIRRVHYFLTFLSGNIVNKELVQNNINPSDFVGTNLPHLNWILSAIFMSKQNACFNEYMVAAKTENTGGYKLCQVFGVGFNVIADQFISQGINKKYFDIINNKMLKTFFPQFVINIRKTTTKYDFLDEDYYSTLKKIYGNYLYFWLITAPVILMPANIAVYWYKTINVMVNIVDKLVLMVCGRSK